jgi:hypothetical protein
VADARRKVKGFAQQLSVEASKPVR